jgi:hypothetical protein
MYGSQNMTKKEWHLGLGPGHVPGRVLVDKTELDELRAEVERLRVDLHREQSAHDRILKDHEDEIARLRAALEDIVRLGPAEDDPDAADKYYAAISRASEALGKPNCC